MYLFSHIPAFPIINAIIKSAYLFCIRLLEAVYCLKVLMYCLVLRVDYLKRKRTLDARSTVCALLPESTSKLLI